VSTVSLPQAMIGYTITIFVTPETTGYSFNVTSLANRKNSILLSSVCPLFHPGAFFFLSQPAPEKLQGSEISSGHKPLPGRLPLLPVLLPDTVDMLLDPVSRLEFGVGFRNSARVGGTFIYLFIN